MKAQLQSRCSTMPEDVQQLVQQITDSPSGRTTPSEVPAGAVGPKQRFKMPQAKDMRTEQSLTKTVEYLLKDIILDTRKPYNVVYDRLRAVRREIVIQMFDARQTIPSSCSGFFDVNRSLFKGLITTMVTYLHQKKVFGVLLNRKHTVVRQLDIYDQVGRGSAHDEIVYFKINNGRLNYEGEVSDVRNGRLRLDFIKGALDNPKINAFALLKGDVSQMPRLHGTEASERMKPELGNSNSKQIVDQKQPGHQPERVVRAQRDDVDEDDEDLDDEEFGEELPDQLRDSGEHCDNSQSQPTDSKKSYSGPHHKECASSKPLKVNAVKTISMKPLAMPTALHASLTKLNSETLPSESTAKNKGLLLKAMADSHESLGKCVLLLSKWDLPLFSLDPASFGVAVLFIMVSCLLHLVATAYFLFLELLSKRDNGYLWVQMLWICFHFLRLLMVVEPCHLAARESRKTIQIVCEIERKVHEPILAEAVKKFWQQLLVVDADFSACGLCRVNRTILTSVTYHLDYPSQVKYKHSLLFQFASAIATYLVILIQFQRTNG
ncbi:hypothetical protein KR059_011733 [Drosophila kikkawai]|nr:hypothetical protein KR059_011733 [Drosophila kikkawai]